jgi:myo-inositol-1(or 4)-monophosphatase
VALRRLGKPGYVKWKGHRDVVSEASLQVQEAIAATILGEFPQSGILAEEGPEDALLATDAEHLWIVDPICGSLNYAQGIPHFGIAIALRSQGTIRAAVVYDPCREELFQAIRGGPALVGSDKIVIQQISEGTEAWSGAILGTDWPRSGIRRERARLTVGLVADQVGEVSMMGSPALGLCYVAAGRLHAYWHLDLRIWDIAAASLILERSGGTLTDAEGTSWLYSDGGYIASNGVIHGFVLHCLQAGRRLDPREQSLNPSS